MDVAFDIETIGNRSMVERMPEPEVKTGNLKDPAKIAEKIAEAKADQIDRMADFLYGIEEPLCQAWWGITTENQRNYNNRIDYIRMIPSSFKTWLSVEPLLGEIDMQLQYIAPEDMPFDWFVVGAESGTNRRPCKLEWIESIVEQCWNAYIPVFVKQIELDGKFVKDINKFPEHLRIRQVPWAERREQ